MCFILLQLFLCINIINNFQDYCTMGKKATYSEDETEEAPFLGKSFYSMETPQEKVLKNIKNREKSEVKSRSKGIRESERSIPESISVEEVDQLTQTISTLLSKNKLNLKNAFGVPLLDIHLYDSVQKNDEHSWRKFSTLLENGYKVYGLKVDFMNDVINKMTGSLRSSEGLNEVSEKLNQHKGEDAAGRQIKLSSLLKSYGKESNYSKHIDKNIGDFQLKDYSKSSSSNHFCRMKIFGAGGLESILLQNLNLNYELRLQLFPHKLIDLGCLLETEESNVQKWRNYIQKRNSDDFSIFKEVSILKNILNDQHFLYQEESNIQIEFMELGRAERDHSVIVIDDSDEVSFTNDVEIINIKKKFGTEGESEQFNNFPNGEVLINIRERFFTKNKDKDKKSKKKKSKKRKQEFVQIDFNPNKKENRSRVLLKRNYWKYPEKKEKQTKNLALLPFNERYSKYESNIYQSSQLDIFHENIKIQVEKSNDYFNFMTSIASKQPERIPPIKQTKESLHNIITNHLPMNFSQLLFEYQRKESIDHPSICFLATLHLANEMNLKLTQKAEHQFTITYS